MAAVDFLASRGLGEAQGKKVDPSGVASQAIEVPTVLRPDQAMERPCGPRAEQHPREKWRTPNAPHKRLCFPGEEKETQAFRTDSLTTRQSVRTALPTQMERVSVGLDAPANPSAQRKALAFPVTRTSLIHRTEIPPLQR